ncbi:hypothetical protein XM38_041560 [Halomicronema hongdechloris C2206]|uniref:FHA domain-containing protein n=1 Tax=Halomicronema hongdechloris C2206 TaxID=1641165 RepID=A0A1Z3HSA6_9CYAN|nr:CHAT domain-containing protein [Halomicronema hongdechloris]ASC73194.1 hypothetical protein XM38_041560 [Halomicronema hongdechloris C2206]
MSLSEPLSLQLAIDRLTVAAEDRYAIWVLESPYPGGYVHHDRIWDEALSNLWRNWQDFFSLRPLPQVPHVPSTYVPQFDRERLSSMANGGERPRGYTSRLMQDLGIALWQWLFDGPIQQSLERSLGMAMGQDKPLRIRLDIRTPALINVPWEIMQAQSGRQAIALSQQILFSRTTSAVDPLLPQRLDGALRILLVLGQDEALTGDGPNAATLQLHEEAQVLKELLEQGTSGLRDSSDKAFCQVHTLLQPEPAELIQQLETGNYNVFFYAGHGIPAPDGGLLFLRPGSPLNGTELAQVLTRQRIKLAVFNACWGGQPDQRPQRTMARSSLAEVLLHHGVPAVLAMRDSIADEEALSFIQAFAQALAERRPVEEAVAIARQQLLTLYKFNQPAWTLPMLYMHPSFDGVILNPVVDDVTRLPGESSGHQQLATLRFVKDPESAWPIYGGVLRIGRRPGNDLVLSEPWVSSQHAEIFCRHGNTLGQPGATYYLRDYSRYGTLYQVDQGWQQVHRGEIELTPGTQLRFGSPNGQCLEFVIEDVSSSASSSASK